MEDKLSSVFSQSYQIKRIKKEIQLIREARQKMGFEVGISFSRNSHLTYNFQISKKLLQSNEKLKNLSKIEFKVVVKKDYPAENPRVYFYNENLIEIGLVPFYDYLNDIVPQWFTKNTPLDIVKAIPSFIVNSMQSNSFKANFHEGDPFDVQKIVSWKLCQSFPLKLIRNSTQIQGLLVIVNKSLIFLLEQSNFQGFFSVCDKIELSQVTGIYKHRSSYTKLMMEIRKVKNRMVVQFLSEQYEAIMEAIVDSMKTTSSKDLRVEQQEDDCSEEEQEKKSQGNELIIDASNIRDVEQQIVVLQSFVENNPNPANIKELVELLKKTVQYYSEKGNQRCNNFLKMLQNIMSNQIMTVMLESEGDVRQQKKEEQYQSILDFA